MDWQTLLSKTVETARNQAKFDSEFNRDEHITYSL